MKLFSILPLGLSLLLSLLLPGPLAMAQVENPINWGVRALKVYTPNPKQPCAFHIHCKRIDYTPWLRERPPLFSGGCEQDSRGFDGRIWLDSD